MKSKQRTHALEVTSLENPFYGISDDEMNNLVANIVNESESTFWDTLTQIDGIIKDGNALNDLALMLIYGLVSTIDHFGRIHKVDPESEFEQSHAEIYQALALRYRVGDTNQLHRAIENKAILFDLLPKLSIAASLRRMSKIQRGSSETEISVNLLQEHIRLHTQIVRNWCYYDRACSLIKKLLKPLDLEIQSIIGVGSETIIDLFLFIGRRNEDRINRVVAAMASIFSEGTTEGVLNIYKAINVDRPDTLSDPSVSFNTTEDVNTLKKQVIDIINSSMYYDFIFSVNDISSELAVDEGAIRKALGFLSHEFGGLADKNVEYIFLDNPVWVRPLIKIDNERYFCVLSTVFISSIFQALDELFEIDPRLKTLYHRRRSDFLEYEVHDIFKSAFPNAHLFSNYSWQDEDGSRYENDLLLKLESYIIIIEVKSGRVTPPALRGAPDRMRQHIRELIVQPSFQSLRLQNRIFRVQNGELKNDLLPDFPFTINRDDRIIRLSVTLEDFAVVQSNLHLLNKIGLSADELSDIATCFLVSDLEIVFDILELSSQKIHYLVKRADLESKMAIRGDEMDLLGLYLKTGFSFGYGESENSEIQLLGLSNKIDEYYNALTEGVHRRKPKQKLSRWWYDVISCLENNKVNKWMDISIILLSFSYEDQHNAEIKYASIKSLVKKKWTKKGHKCAVTLSSIYNKESGILLFAYCNGNSQNRNDNIQSLAANCYDSLDVNSLAIIGTNIDSSNYPYSIVALSKKGPS